jgi:hypothetical protein
MQNKVVQLSTSVAFGEVTDGRIWTARKCRWHGGPVAGCNKWYRDRHGPDVMLKMLYRDRQVRLWITLVDSWTR